MMDLVIRGGSIADGTGKTPIFSGNVGICEGRIVAITQEELIGKTSIDARGLIVAPGFIDVHSHGDFLPLLGEEYRYSRIRQGITTELGGQCGIGALPYFPEKMEAYRGYTTPVLGEPSEGWNFTDLDSYAQCIQGKMPHNLALLIGLGALRSGISGLDPRPLTNQERKEMSLRYETQLQEGAFGLSLGLSYLPGVYAREEELLALGKITARYGGIIMAHIRSHGKDMLVAMKELMDLGRKTGAKIHISHARSYKNKDFGVTWEEILEAARQGRAEGLDLTLDQHPYTAGSTFLNQLLPPAYRSMKCLLDDGLQKEIEEKISDPLYQPSGWDNFSLMVGFEHILLPKEGGTLGELAKKAGIRPYALLREILIREEMNAPMVVLDMFSLEDAAHLLQDEKTFLGSDGLPSGIPHPRLYGAFPTFLATYVRENKYLGLEEAVHKMCGGEILGLQDRGRVQVGFQGDLTLFDQNRVGHTEIYGKFGDKPSGIRWVLLKGVPVYDGDHILDHRGELLRRENHAQ